MSVEYCLLKRVPLADLHKLEAYGVRVDDEAMAGMEGFTALTDGEVTVSVETNRDDSVGRISRRWGDNANVIFNAIQKAFDTEIVREEY